MRPPFSYSGIYALVDPQRREPIAYTRALLEGGVRVLQVRAKAGIARDLLASLVALAHGYKGIVIVNDDVAAALAADGLHLGQEDARGVDLRALRAQLGSRIIGLSCGTPAEARAADPDCLDYLGVGPIFATRSKSDAGNAIGVSGVRAVVTATTLPCVAIGGIDKTNIRRARESNARMAAIISALADADDPQQLARELSSTWNAA